MGKGMTADAALWLDYRRSRDSRLRDALVQKHLVLVKRVAARVASRLPSHIAMDDLFSAGLVGFLRAIEEYDPGRGVEFGAYAGQLIRGAIFDELRRLDWVPRGVRRRLREAERAMEALARRLGRAPTDAEVADELGMDVEQYGRLLGEGGALLSLDAPLAREDGVSAVESVMDPDTPSPFNLLAARERQALLARAIERLPRKEGEVLALYYYEELTMQEIGQALGVSESRVSQIHSSAILRLRVAFRRARVGAGELDLPATNRGRRPS
jgi:RNA polymerase sigma factor for flagellar operon FliA